ncbi:MAG: response regulator [Planctomycetaceae bacterium]|jgi:putative two-component system response regulator|nr:response regulator [Planctomycetaceae bacterium]
MRQERQKIVIVDDSITNLTAGENALADLYDVFTVPSGEKLFKLLLSVTPDLILLDVDMPEMSGYEVIRILKSNPKTETIPVIFLTAMNDLGNELKGLSEGAVDYVAKPFSIPLLRKRIEVRLLVTAQQKMLQKYNADLKCLVEERTKRILELQNTVFDLLVNVVEYRDNGTAEHIGRTQRLLNLLLQALERYDVYAAEIAGWDHHLLVRSALLHDIGKVAIRDHILLKPTKLTHEEFEVMKNHTVIGAAIIAGVEKESTHHGFTWHAKRMAATHHEKWDGSGYPAGLAAYNIPLEGRLMAVVDVYDALISVRPYKQPLHPDRAIDVIRREAGIHFDPHIVGAFLKIAPRIRTGEIPDTL